MLPLLFDIVINYYPTEVDKRRGKMKIKLPAFAVGNDCLSGKPNKLN